MNFFDGLYPYEIVLLVLGVLLFLVLMVAFVVLLVRGKPFVKVLSRPTTPESVCSGL